MSMHSILRSIAKLTGLLGLYPPAHPVVEQTISEAIENISTYLSLHPELTVGIVEHRLVVEDMPVEDCGIIEMELMNSMEKAGIGSVTIRHGVSGEEMSLLCGAIVSNRTDLERYLAENGAVHIRINTARYAKIKDGEIISGEKTGEDITWVDGLQGNSLDSMIWSVIGKAVKSPEDQKRVFDIIHKQLKEEIDDKVKVATLTLEIEKKQINYDKERTEMVLSHIADGLIMVDDNGKILMMNEAAENIFGKRLLEKAGRVVTEGLGEEHMVALSRDLSSVIKEGMEKEIEVDGANETKRVLKSSTALVHNKDGKVVGMISVLSDITKQQELERLKQDFVSHVTHEIRTPLVAVKQSVSLVLDKTAGTINENQERMLEVVKRNIERLSRFINDILDVQKMEAGKLIVSRQPVDIRNPVSDVLQSLTPWAESRDITLSSSVPDDLPYVHADADRVIQILTNLTGNAIKFTPAGGKVSINVTPPMIKGDISQPLKLSVIDSGRGIAKDDIDRIFEKFEQAGGREATDVRGSGLGLSIVKSLVGMQGGKIWVESIPGTGSKFTFTLPFYRQDDPEEITAVFRNNPSQEKKGFLSRLGFANVSKNITNR